MKGLIQQNVPLENLEQEDVVEMATSLGLSVDQLQDVYKGQLEVSAIEKQERDLAKRIKESQLQTQAAQRSKIWADIKASDIARTVKGLEKQIAAQEQAGQTKIASELANSKLDLQLQTIQDIKDSGYTALVVGSTPFTRGFEGGIPVAVAGAFGGTDDVRSALGSLMSKDVLGDFISAKAEGAVFGALSNEELNLLRDAANRIAPRVNYDDDGKFDYVDMSEEAFYKELDVMKGILTKAKTRNTVKTLPKELVGEAAMEWDNI